MKKLLSVIAVVMSVLMLLPVFAGAASVDSADKLKDLGLFLGTDKGYELERTPTRAEAAVMLVRFLGKEAYAKANVGKTKLPFDDVPQWAKPYVEYLYANGLTVGVSNTKYGTDTACSAQMYVTFMLRALGYSDLNGDFEYADAIEYGRAKDLVTKSTYSEKEFLREHMVLLAEKALTLGTADDRYEMLVYKLSREGAVTEAQAEDIAMEAKSKKIKIAFVGDSITWSGGCVNQDEDSYPAWVEKWLGNNFECRNFGQGGASYVDGQYKYINVAAFQKGIDYEPDVVIIMFGTNDAAMGTPASMAGEAQTLIKRYQKLKTKPYIVLCTAPSCPQLRNAISSNTNRVIESVASSMKLDLIDTFYGTDDASLSYDNVHFTNAGYAVLANTIFEKFAPLLAKKGYLEEEAVKAKIKYAKADTAAAKKGIERTPIAPIDEDKLVELYKGTEIGKNSMAYLCADYDASGAIYGIPKNMYNNIKKGNVLTEYTWNEGWITIAPSDLSLESYPLTTWMESGHGGFWDVRAYVKEIKGCYFLWLDNVFRFGDIDGGWSAGMKTVTWKSTNGSSNTTDKFLYVTYDINKYTDFNTRTIQYVAEDGEKNGYIYAMADYIADELNYVEGKDEKMFGITWKKVDSFGIYYNISFYDWARNDDFHTFNRDKNLNRMERMYDYALYVGEKDGTHYLWCRNAKNLGVDYNSDCWILRWPVETENGTVMHSSNFYHLTGVARGNFNYPTHVKF